MDDLKIYLNIIKFFIYNFKEEKYREYLFVGNTPKEIRIIVDKLESNKSISKIEEEKLELLYGNGALKNLQNKINDETELIYESIYSDDKIIDLKKKIKLYLSDSDDERIYEIPNQYFYINCYKDNRFYDMVSNIFYEDDVLSNKQVMNELNKIIKTKLNLDSSRYTKNKLLDELKKKK